MAKPKIAAVAAPAQAKHAPVFVQHGGRKSPREYAHCIAGQGIGLLAMPQCLQQPGLAVPLLEGGARSIHGHREWAVRAHRGRENRRNAARYGADRSAISTVHGSSERSEGETQTEGGGMIPTDEQRQKARNALDDVEDALQSMRDLREALAPTEARIDLDKLIAKGERNVDTLRQAIRDLGVHPLQWGFLSTHESRPSGRFSFPVCNDRKLTKPFRWLRVDRNISSTTRSLVGTFVS